MSSKDEGGYNLFAGQLFLFVFTASVSSLTVSDIPSDGINVFSDILLISNTAGNHRQIADFF